MSLLTVLMSLAMLLGSVGFVIAGLVLAEEVLWRRSKGEGSMPVSGTRKTGAVLLIAIGVVLLLTTFVTGGLIVERELRLTQLEATIARLETRVRALEGPPGQAHSDMPPGAAAR